MNIRHLLEDYTPIVITKARLQKAVNDAAIAARSDERKFWADYNSSHNNTLGMSDSFFLYEGNNSVKELVGSSKDSFANRKSWSATDSKRSVSLEVTRLIQDAAHIKAHTDAHGASIVNNIINFTIGRGVNVSSIVPDIDNLLRRFRYQNNLDRKERAMVKAGYINGEYFISYLLNPVTRFIRVARYTSEEVADIEYLQGDTDAQVAFKIERFGAGNPVWVPSIKYNLMRNWDPTVKISNTPIAANELCLFVKYGDNDDEPRGRVPLHPALKFLKMYEDWLIDRVRLNHERAKVVWIRKNVGQTSINSNPMRAPKGGITLEENQNVTYRTEAAKIGADDAKEDGLAILYTVGASVILPIHLLDQRADEQVYSSIRKADTPFSQMVEAHQDLWEDSWRQQYQFIVKQYADWGVIKSEYQVPTYVMEPEAIRAAFYKVNMMVAEDVEAKVIIDEVKAMLSEGKKLVRVKAWEIPVNQSFPEVVRENPLEIAKVLEIHRGIGIASLQTLSSKAGYNWRTELAQIRQERATDTYNKDENDKDEPEKSAEPDEDESE